MIDSFEGGLIMKLQVYKTSQFSGKTFTKNSKDGAYSSEGFKFKVKSDLVDINSPKLFLKRFSMPENYKLNSS
jgi:hypothetical protein